MIGMIRIGIHGVVVLWHDGGFLSSEGRLVMTFRSA